MIFRAESFPAEAADAFAAKIVKAILAPATACARLFSPKRRTADIFALSEHELRDIGLQSRRPGYPARHDPLYDLLELMPRAFFGHRRTRWP